MNNLVDSKILLDLGLNQKNTWIIYDKAPNAFFNHLTRYFDENNLLSDDELLKIKELEESEEMLPEDEIAKHLEMIEEQIPDVHEMTDEHLKKLESDLDFHMNLLSNRELRSDKIQQSIQAVQNKTDELERENFDLDHREKELKEMCTESIRKLDQLMEVNQTKCRMITELFVQPQNPPILMNSFIEDRDMNKLKLMTSQIEQFVTNCIKNNGDQTDLERKNAMIIEVYKKIRELDSKILADEVLLEGFNNIQNIENFEIKEIQSICDIQDEISRIQMETEKLDDYHAMLMADLISTTEKNQEMRNASLFNEFFNARSTKSINKLNKIKSSNEILENVIQMVELIWFALSVDMKRLNDRVDNSLEVNSAVESVNLRINLMKNLNNLNHSDMTADLVMDKIREKMEQIGYRGEFSTDLVTTFQEIVKVQDEIEECRRTFASGKNLFAIHEQLKLIESQRKRLADFVYNGPTNCPQLTDCKFITKISSEEQRMKQFGKVFSEMKSRFSTDILQPWQADEIHRLEKSLWIYFLTEPQKFFGAIQKIKKKASEKGAMTLKTRK